MKQQILNHINEIKTAVYLAFVFLNIDTDVVKILTWLMLIDTISGIIKSFAIKKHFDFKILFFGGCSKLLVLLIPMTLALVAKGISKSYDFTPVLDSVLRLLVVSEGLSIITNFYVIKTKKEVKNFDIISMLLSAIRKGMLAIINGTLKSLEK
jgi:phage-related holin